VENKIKPYPLNMVLIDLVYDICATNETVKKNGFFLSEPATNTNEYFAQNTYYQLKYSDPKLFELFTELKTDLSERIAFFFKYYQIIREMNFFKRQSIEKIRSNYIQLLLQSLNQQPENQEQVSEYKELSQNLSSIENHFATVNHYWEMIEIQKNNIEKLHTKLKFSSLLLLPSKENSRNNYAENTEYQTNYENLKKTTAEISLDSIFENLDKIYEHLNRLPAQFKIEYYPSHLSSINKQYNYLRSFQYSQGLTFDTPTFLKKYVQFNDSILVYLSTVQRLITNYKREILATELNRNEYLTYNLSIFKQSVDQFKATDLSEADKTLIANIYSYITLLEKPNSDVLNFEFINYLRDNIIPQIVAFNVKYSKSESPESKQQIKMPKISVQNLENILNFGYFSNINSFYDPQNIISHQVMELAAGFIGIIGTLNKLDEVGSYVKIFSTINDIGNLYPTTRAAQSFNSISNNVRKYTQFNTETEQIDFDVESFLTLLSDNYGDVSFRRMGMYFTVGVNQVYFFKPLKINGSTDSTLVRNLGYASEKIGFQYKIVDFNQRQNEKRKQSYTYFNQKKPYISSWYAAIYGSGILYNVVNTTNRENFNYPMFGLCTGLTFYNSIDFNIMCSLPATNQPLSKASIGFGFDIKIGEYFEAINNQRKERIAMKNK